MSALPDSRPLAGRRQWPAALAAFGVLVAGLFWPLFERMPRDSIDFSVYVQLARRMAQAGAPQSERFGFQLLSLLAAGFSAELDDLARAAAAVATLAMALKAVMSAQWLAHRTGPRRALALALVVVFVAPITFTAMHPTWQGRSAVHLGQMSGLIFHNPTTVVVFPLVLGLFAASWRGRPVATAVLAAVQCLVKPNFVLAWAPVFAALELRRRGRGWRALARTAAVLAPVTAVLAWQFLTTQNLGEMVIEPLRAWKRTTPNIPLSLARSLAFPALLVAVHFGEVRRRTELVFAWAILAVATAQHSLIYLRGSAHFGDWAWGRFLAVYIVFLLSVELFAEIAARRESWRASWRGAANAALVAVLALHLGSGIFYYWQGVHLGRW